MNHTSNHIGGNVYDSLDYKGTTGGLDVVMENIAYDYYRKDLPVKDDSISHALGVMKKYSGADELTQAIVQELIEKVIVTDPEHVEIVCRDI